MEYYYQWPISKESTPMPEHKKWNDGFWGKSARCMRRRGLCLPPSNYFPRGHRPQQNSAPFRSYDHSWKRLVPENPQTYCGRDFERTKALPAPSYKKRPCHNRGNKKTFKPCDNGYFPGASPQHIPGPYCGGPIINDVYFNAFDYQHHIVERGHDMSYDPYLDYSNGFSRFCESSAPMESVENRGGNPSFSGNCDDLLSTAVKVAIEDPLPEQADFLVPSADLGEGILELPKNEAEAAAQTLEQLFPSLRFSSTEGLEETHEFLNPVENSTTAQDEPRKEGELEQEARLLPPSQLSSCSEEKTIEQQEKIGGSLEDSKPLTDGLITQDSVQFLANQNQFLSDVLSQFMSGGFDMNQRFLEKYQTADETPNVNSAKPYNPSPSSSIPSVGNIIQRENNTQEIQPFNELGMSENLQCKDESKYPYKTMELSNIESEMICNSSSIDWDSFDYIFGKNPETKCKETTQSTTNTQEISSAFTKPNSVFETNEEEFLRCVNPNAILKDKRPRKRVKRVITNVEVKTKRVRQNHKKGSKNDEEETVQSMCKTDVYTSTEESDIHHELLDAQTQVEEQVVLKVDAETQWYESDVKGGTTSRNQLKNLPELDQFDVNFNNCVLEPFPMPTLENQNIPKEGNIEDNSKTDTHMYKSLFRSLGASVISSSTASKENKCFESGVDDRKIHVKATESMTDSKRNSTEGYTTETVADFLSDVLNCVPIKPSEDNLVKIQASKPDMQHSDSLEVAAYEVCSGESVSQISSLPVQDAVETGVTTTTKTVPGGLGCGESGEMYSSKSNESNLKSLETMQESEVKTLNEQEYITQTGGIEEDASNGKFPENEKDYKKWESVKLETNNQGPPRFDMSEMQSEETVIIKGPSVLGKSEQVERKEFEIKNTPQEKSTDKNDGSLSECKREILPMEVFQYHLIPQSSNKNRPGRPRKKRTLKETNRKSRKAIKSSKTPLSQEILVIPQVHTTVQKRTLDFVSDQPPLKKRRLASLRCRPEFQKMM